MRLWIKLALAMVAVSLAPLVVVSIQVLDLTSDQAAVAERAARQREAVAVADEIARWVELKAQAVEGWIGLYPDLLVRQVEVQEGLLKAVYRAVPGAVTVALFDEDGLAGQPGRPVRPQWLDVQLSPDDPLAERQSGSEARATAFVARAPRPDRPGAVWIGDPYTAPALPSGLVSGPSLPISARSPFREPATLAVELAMDEVDALLAGRSTEDRGFSLVLIEGQPVLSHGPTVPIEKLRPALGADTAAFAAQDGRAGALARVAGTRWVVVMSEPTAGSAGWPQLRNRLLVSLAVSLLVAVLAGVLVARTVSRPIAGVRDAANRIAEGDLGHRVPPAGRDEIGELAADFNRMAGRLSGTLHELEARRAEVEAFNEELQDRVDARTRDLEEAQAELLRTGQLAAVGEVGAGLAHELNNPLASVLGLLQIIRARSGSSGSESALLAQAEAEAQRCREVVEAMLQLSATEAAVGPGSVADVAAVLRQSVRLVEGASRQREVVLEVVAAPGERVLVGIDEQALRRALAQLLQSLVAGLPTGARLTLDVDAGEVVWVVLSSDRPVAAGARRDDYRAAGLGLWVARRLIASHGGRLHPPDSEEEPWRLELPAA